MSQTPPPARDHSPEPVAADRLVWGFADLRLIGPDAPDWAQLDREPGAQRVKVGHGRSIWRVPVGPKVVYVKRFDHAGGRSAVLRRLGWDRAKREIRLTIAAEAAGVPVAPLTAYGHNERFSLLLFPAHPEATNLAELWDQTVPSRAGAARKAAVDGLAGVVVDLLAKAHAAGFEHRDLHPANIVLTPRSEGGWQAALIDLPGSRLGRPVAAAAQRNLAQLEHHFRCLTTRTERLRFLREYLAPKTRENRNAQQRKVRHLWATAIARVSARQEGQLIRRRDRKLHSDNAHFGRARFDAGWVGQVVLQLPRRHRFPEPGVLDRSLADWRELLATLHLMAGDADFEQRAAALGLRIERAQPAGLGQRLIWTLAGGPHRQAFVEAHRRRHRDEPRPLALAWFERFEGAGLKESWLIWAATPSHLRREPAP